MPSPTPDPMSATITFGPSSPAALILRRAGRELLKSLVERAIVHPEEWENLAAEARDSLESIDDGHALLARLIDLKLINAYQRERIQNGDSRGMVLGNYRVLGEIGSGAGGVVFAAEHMLMRRNVAIKVMPVASDESADNVTRFLREMRAVARLDHPNIVAVFDAGIDHRPCAGEDDLYYFAMEHLAGQDLQGHVEAKPLSITAACTLIYQVASALDEAHQHLLVHRDVKPSNILITDAGCAKLLDFGLVRHQRGHAFTTPDEIIGTLDYMAPEQAIDATDVDIRADIFSLGATLFYALTGASPFVLPGTVLEALHQRATQRPRSARAVRGEIPIELEEVMSRLMALKPEDRIATPQAVMTALLPFVRCHPPLETRPDAGAAPSMRFAAGLGRVASSMPQVLIVDHDPMVRRQLARPLSASGLQCLEAADAESALAEARAEPIQAVLLAVDLADTDGRAVLKALCEYPPTPNLKIIMTTAHRTADEMVSLMTQGAADFLCLPVSTIQLIARVKSALKHKHAQDRTDELSRQLLDLNVELERSVHTQRSDIAEARTALVLALARLVEHRSTETISHLTRMQRYSGLLAREAASQSAFSSLIDLDFIQRIECSAPLHDIGNVGLPDHILLKAGRLETAERAIMQTHTTIGAETLLNVARESGATLDILQMAIDIARHHHEHFDGTGYPDGLRGNNIPLAARIVALADAYDSLRSRRTQRPCLAHSAATQIILEGSSGKFDPLLLNVFQRCAPQMERTFRDLPDSVLMFE